MAVAITHSTAADGTFSVSGATAWDAAHSLAGLGTGVETALGVNVGSAGAFVTFNGALGTPSSGVATNLTGTAAGLTAGTASAVALGGITGLGTNVATALAVNVGSAGAFVTFNGALGTPSSGTLTNATGLPEGGLTLADNTTNNFSTTKHGFVPKGTNVGNFLKDDGTWAAPTASATLNGISAATGDQAGISNGDNNIVWNWQKTTDSEVAFNFGESAASTGGTAENQVILRASTLAASTAVPFQISPRGANEVSWLAAGGVQQASKGSADAVGYALNFRKSRGSVGTPTVLTTGDDLATISGYGYVGSTGYVEAATIRIDSTGTIANSSTGVGGIIRFETREVGGAMQEAFRIQGGASSPQMLASNFGASSSLAAYAFSGVGGTGMQYSANGNSELSLMHSGSVQVQIFNGSIRVPTGSAGTPGITDNSNVNSGLFFGNTILGIATGSIENSRFIAGALQHSKGTGDAVGYAINYRKARGTVASPTVITTGDDIATINGAAYVGATGTYVTAATLTIDTDGTIANDATGVGGIFRFSTRKVAGSVTERMTIDNNETAAETSILVSINGGAPVRVSKGANDSGGTGFAVLRIPN